MRFVKKRAEYFEIPCTQGEYVDGMEFCLQLQTDRYEPDFSERGCDRIDRKKSRSK